MSLVLEPLPNCKLVCHGDYLLIECPEGVFDCTSITHLAHMLQQLHPKLSTGNKRALLLELMEALEKSGAAHAPQIRGLLEQRQNTDFLKLNEPAFEAFAILSQVGLPEPGSEIFVSTATANSWPSNSSV